MQLLRAEIMKKNTQKILLSLYSKVGSVKNRVKLENIKALVPELTDGGFRSLIHVLKKQGVISTQRILGVTSINLTQHGNIVLEAEFPALSTKWEQWDGSWSCLVFMESPQSDKQFRYLRKLLIAQGALSISRGVYMSPGGFSDVVLRECQTSYHSNVLIFSVGDWKIAAESSFIIEKYGLLDLVETYSGLSSDVDRLLKTTDGENRLMEGVKNDISLVYDRVTEVLLEDPGFCTFYFKEVENVKTILLRLNSIISI